LTPEHVAPLAALGPSTNATIVWLANQEATMDAAEADFLLLGMKGSVLAIDKGTGAIVWQTKLQDGFLGLGEYFVTLVVEAGRVYAGSHGKLYCLDMQRGEVLWVNDLPGLGYGLMSLAVEGVASAPPPVLARRKAAEESHSSQTPHPG
jgi:outer membrane protein assembly factor BamB